MTSHDNNRLIPLVENLLDAQRTLTEYVVPQHVPRVSAPASMPVMSTTAYPAECVGHQTQVPKHERQDKRADVNMSDGHTVGDKRVEQIICGRQAVHVLVQAFGAVDGVSTLDQAEEMTVSEIPLQGTLRMLMNVIEDRRTEGG